MPRWLVALSWGFIALVVFGLFVSWVLAIAGAGDKERLVTDPLDDDLLGADLLGKCCGDWAESTLGVVGGCWLSNHTPKEKVDDSTTGFLVVCTVHDDCEGFVWDGKNKRLYGS